MKVFTNFFDKEIFEQKLLDLKHIDFSLFVETIPKHQEELSPINIISLYEPNEYFGLHDWVIKNKDLFNIILTWDDKVLNNCSNALYQPFGHTWFKPDQYNKNHKKEFKIVHLRGSLLKSYGHQIRWDVLNRKNEIKVPIKFYETYGDRHNIEQARIDKEEIFGDSMFGIAIENFSHRGFFTEKILDCFLLKTIPIYWGCSNIEDFFNIEGIIRIENADDAIYSINNLTKEFYISKKDIIEENWRIAQQYVNYEQNIVDQIKSIFELNKLL